MGLEANGAEQTPTQAMQEINVDQLLEAAARYDDDDIDDVELGLASTGISMDSKDSQGRTGPDPRQGKRKRVESTIEEVNGQLDCLQAVLDAWVTKVGQLLGEEHGLSLMTAGYGKIIKTILEEVRVSLEKIRDANKYI